MLFISDGAESTDERRKKLTFVFAEQMNIDSKHTKHSAKNDTNIPLILTNIIDYQHYLNKLENTWASCTHT